MKPSRRPRNSTATSRISTSNPHSRRPQSWCPAKRPPSAVRFPLADPRQLQSLGAAHRHRLAAAIQGSLRQARHHRARRLRHVLQRIDLQPAAHRTRQPVSLGRFAVAASPAPPSSHSAKRISASPAPPRTPFQHLRRQSQLQSRLRADLEPLHRDLAHDQHHSRAHLHRHQGHRSRYALALNRPAPGQVAHYVQVANAGNFIYDTSGAQFHLQRLAGAHAAPHVPRHHVQRHLHLRKIHR